MAALNPLQLLLYELTQEDDKNVVTMNPKTLFLNARRFNKFSYPSRESELVREKLYSLLGRIDTSELERKMIDDMIRGIKRDRSPAPGNKRVRGWNNSRKNLFSRNRSANRSANNRSANASRSVRRPPVAISRKFMGMRSLANALPPVNQMGMRSLMNALPNNSPNKNKNKNRSTRRRS